MTDAPVQHRVVLHQRLGLGGWLLAWATGRSCLHGGQTFALRQWLKRNLGAGNTARPLSYGDLDHSPGVRCNAYALALQQSQAIGQRLRPLSERVERELGVDMALVVRKFLMETLFASYEFQGLARQYQREHPQAVLVLEPILGDAGAGSSRKRWSGVSYMSGLMALPLYAWAFARRHFDSAEAVLKDAVICEVDGPKMLAMFLDLFGGRADLQFVTEPQYRHHFTEQQIRTHRIASRSLGPLARARLHALRRIFVQEGWSRRRDWAPLGSLLFELYGTLARGLLQTVPAHRCTYFVYEHLFTSKAVRNEFMRVDGNRTVSVPYGTHVDSHFFAPSFGYNYDILCSSGELQEQVYRLQQARTPVVLRTGPYEANQSEQPDAGRAARIAPLAAFRGEATTITILSSGIQDETRTGEVKLMELARRLAVQPGVRVFLRPKPVPPPEKFRGFYDDACAGVPGMLLTGPEYRLTDFLGVTDLFVTFWSHSAADLCAAGGAVVSIDFMDDDAVPLWQTDQPDCFLPEATAFDRIMDWVADNPPGTRAAHAARMEALRGRLCQRATDFNAYKAALLKQLQPWMPAEARASYGITET